MCNHKIHISVFSSLNSTVVEPRFQTRRSIVQFVKVVTTLCIVMSFQMDRMEKSAHSGLIAMAASDALFCMAALPHAWVDQSYFYFSKAGFDFYYVLYKNVFINIFAMTSTWLTVFIALSRYFAVCHPLQARRFIGMS